MALRDLVRLVSPPATPFEAEGNWYAARIVAGSEFPPDFEELISHYGSGAFFQTFLKVYNPLSVSGLAGMKQSERVYQQLRTGLYPLPLPVHPEKPGLLFWGSDENGGGYAWLTKGKPDKWPVVYLGHGSEEHPLQYRMTITSFLAGYAVDRFPELVPGGDAMTDEMRVFTPRPPQQVPPTKPKKPPRKKRKG